MILMYANTTIESGEYPKIFIRGRGKLIKNNTFSKLKIPLMLSQNYVIEIAFPIYCRRIQD